MPDQRDLASILLKHGYTGTKKIGEGSFGVAVLVEDAEGNKNVAKLVDISRASAKETQEARREARLLSQVKHPYIVRYRENFAERGWLCIVMDFCDGGDLGDQIEAAKKKKTPIPEKLVLKWFTQATLSLKYLHSKHILHRDLKPANIFLSKSGDLRLGDFGISKVMACTAAFAKTFVGTPYYLSPEVISEKPYSWPSDIWSMGCILYQMCALTVPFDAQNITGLAAKVTRGPIPSLPSNYSDVVRQLQLEMMERSPDRRPTADAIINKAHIQAVVRAMLEQAQGAKKEEKPKAKHEILDQFARFDQNGDGAIDRQELGRVLKHLDASVWTDDNIGQIMLVADTNKDGRIQFDEFIEWIFGGASSGEGSKKGVAVKIEQLIGLANLAVEHEDVEDVLEQILGWRQYIDMGCLRVMPPEVCAKTCEAVARISLRLGSLLDGASKEVAHKITRQIRAILQNVEQLLVESSRQHVLRVGTIVSRTAVRGFCLERADGLRLGVTPSGNLTDDAMRAGNVKWEMLMPGERIVEVKGSAAKSKGGRATSPEPSKPGSSARGRSPEPDDAIAGNLVICTSHGRQLEYGSKLPAGQGAPFQFKAPDGAEIEELVFSGKTCTGIKTAPKVVDWPQEKLASINAAFASAAQAFWPLLMSTAFKLGPKYGSYALLEGRRLGLKDLAPPSGVDAPAAAAQLAGVKPPDHWDMAAMGGLGADGLPSRLVAETELGQAELTQLQRLLISTFKSEPSSEDQGKALMPTGLKLERASRLQTWRAWSTYAARQHTIRTELATAREEGRMGPTETDAMSAAKMEALGVRLDPDANCRWLYHGISEEAAASGRLLDPDFDIDTAGAEDGMLYGRGIYLREYCNHVDRNVPEGKEGLRCMLLCRATLGNMLQDDAILPDKAHLISRCTGGEHHSVLGDREERCPGSLRDFVVYDKDQVYPEFVLWYRRVYR